MHFGLLQVCWEHLHVATTAVNLLLMLDCELNDQGLALVAEGLKTSRGGIETSILAGLKT